MPFLRHLPNDLRPTRHHVAPRGQREDRTLTVLAELRDSQSSAAGRERPAVDPRQASAGSPALPCATDRAQAHPELRRGAPHFTTAQPSPNATEPRRTGDGARGAEVNPRPDLLPKRPRPGASIHVEQVPDHIRRRYREGAAA